VVKTCANPACAAPFLYWRGGKLFRFDVKAPCEPYLYVPGQICEPKPRSRRSVFFWLCENCCSTMVLSFDPHRGLRVLPLKSGKRDGRLTGRTSVQESSAPPLLSGGRQGSIGVACDSIEGGR
jgi:hypothetical protein